MGPVTMREEHSFDITLFLARVWMTLKALNTAFRKPCRVLFKVWDNGTVHGNWKLSAIDGILIPPSLHGE